MLEFRYRILAFLVSFCGLVSYCEGFTDPKVKVPPGDELLIIDPNQDPRNRPTPNFVKDEHGNQRIEIPPTIIVHRYYYSGDRDFQGPMLPGGPTVLVANHPRTGEQVSVQAMLLPGAPRIRYCKTCIIYNYADRCITLDFGLCGDSLPDVVYQRDGEITLAAKQHLADASKTATSFVTTSGLPNAVSEVRKRGQGAIQATGERINSTGSAVFGRALRLLDSTPQGNLLKPSARAGAGDFIDSEKAGITKELRDTVGTNR